MPEFCAKKFDQFLRSRLPPAYAEDAEKPSGTPPWPHLPAVGRVLVLNYSTMDEMDLHREFAELSCHHRRGGGKLTLVCAAAMAYLSHQFCTVHNVILGSGAERNKLIQAEVAAVPGAAALLDAFPLLHKVVAFYRRMLYLQMTADEFAAMEADFRDFFTHPRATKYHRFWWLPEAHFKVTALETDFLPKLKATIAATLKELAAAEAMQKWRAEDVRQVQTELLFEMMIET